MELKILAQGYLDGACYLYSIMNAYKTLIYPDMDNEDFCHLKPVEKSGLQKWESLIRVSPDTTDILVDGAGFFYYFLKSNTVNAIRSCEAQSNHFIRMAFDLLADCDHEFLVSNISWKMLGSFDFTKSVIVLPVYKEIASQAGNKIGYHWFCVNGRTDDKLHIACSGTMLELPIGQYYERLDEKHHRYYNNMIKIQDINEYTLDFGANCIYQITKIR